jgi:hypothetical protein
MSKLLDYYIKSINNGNIEENDLNFINTLNQPIPYLILSDFLSNINENIFTDQNNDNTIETQFINNLILKSNIEPKIFKILIFKKCKYVEFIRLILDKVKPTNEFVDYMINSKIITKNIDLLKYLEVNLELLNKLLNININILDLYEYYNIEFDISTFYIICKLGNLEILNNYIFKYNIIPDKICLDNSLKSLNVGVISKILSYKIIPDIISLKILLSNQKKLINQSKIIELLINFGLSIDLVNLELIISYKSYLDNLEKFNIKYDEELYFICFKYRFFPESYQEKFKGNIDNNILILRNMCLTKQMRVDKILLFLENKNIKFDRYCLDNAYIAQNNRLTALLTIKLKCKPTIFSIIFNSRVLIELGDLVREELGSLSIGYEDMILAYDYIIN